ncbi:MAG: hypothetical protein BWY21_00572 [Parcubacteria group bacterium ADurb.Bin216]|nr:MAG: hypothetical protein BWY21_00572 [Parcubacteria group bacterium ADurb.Bin216]
MGEESKCKEERGKAYEEVSEVRKAKLAELFLLSKVPDDTEGYLSQLSLTSLRLANIASSMSRMPVVYVSGPYSSDPDNCTKRAIEVANTILSKGGVPYIPHLTQLWHLHTPKMWEFWIVYDCYILNKIKPKYLVRIPGESKGADIEVRIHKSTGGIVYELSDIEREDFQFI